LKPAGQQSRSLTPAPQDAKTARVGGPYALELMDTARPFFLCCGSGWHVAGDGSFWGWGYSSGREMSWCRRLRGSRPFFTYPHLRLRIRSPSVWANLSSRLTALHLRCRDSIAYLMLSVRRFVYPPFASAISPVWICDLAGRKGWGTHSVVRDEKKERARPTQEISRR